MSNPTPTVSEESPMPNQPIVGVAAIAVRDTAHQTPTQVIGMNPNWPGSDTITSVVDAADMQSGTGYRGGPLPAHSMHWNDYFATTFLINPTGRSYRLNANADPSQIAGMMAQQQNLAGGNGETPWETLRTLLNNSWRKGSAPATYKISNP